MATFKQTFESKLIYVFRINDDNHKGVLKVGETTVNTNVLEYFSLEPNCKILNDAAKKRINSYTSTAGIRYELLYTEIACYSKEKDIISFQDHEVHDVLERSGIEHKYFGTEKRSDEWFITDLETVKNAIKAVKEGRTSLNPAEISKDKSPIELRPEQLDAVSMAVKKFKKHSGKHQALWNAKMRFGKTLSALQVIKECDYRKTLILTHRPDVVRGWYEDYQKIFYDRPEYKFVSKKFGDFILRKGDNNKSQIEIKEMEDNFLKKLKNDVHNTAESYIFFKSIQDMRGSELVGGKFDKNELIFNINWDLIIIDEAHEGTQTELGKKVLSACRKEDTRLLHLSGTPFNLMDDFNEDEVFTWDYIMEQRAKANWDIIHQGDPNPYACLPKLNIYTYDLGSLFNEYADSDIAFNFKEFFRVGEDGNFIHESNIKQFLDLLVKEDPDSNYPYSTQKYRDNFRHSLWMVPGVKEAKALSTLLQNHPVFSNFRIANVAGDGDEEVEEKNALDLVEKAIGSKPEESYSITLSCGRLTTGVSVKPWTACFMLAGSYNTAASAYMQTIFRVQTPAIIGGKQKTECFVFDFAPDRTLKVIAETAKISSKAGNTTNNDRKILGEFMNFCPIIGFEGSRTVAYDTEKMLEQLKKVYVEKVVRNGFEDNYLYNSDLMKLDAIELKEFETLKGIIGTTKSMASTGDIDINTLGLTDEEYEELGKKKTQKEKRELTPEEEERVKRLAEAKKNRDSAISILRGISIRMPLMIYGADLNKELDGEEEEITINNFADKIDDQSWIEFMPEGVSKEFFSKFKKYYDEDIFRAAGKKIRQMAKAADSFSIEERIGRIATIFNSFRNPDKETVLTPWRVVNMHMTDCLGGYRFYDEEYKETKEEPVFVEQPEVTKNVYRKNTHILEINSKSGLYALYCAYSIYKTRAKLELGPKPTREMEKDLWRKVLKDNIFVICKTPMAKSITKRTLAGFTDMKVNAHFFEDLVNQMKNKPENFIDKVSKASYWKKEGIDMKFDAIVGNPPYNETLMGSNSSNKSLSKQLYPLFIESAISLNSKYVSIISPSRWFTADAQDKSFIKLREYIKKNNHLKKLVNYSNSKNIFPSVTIAGGINYWLFDKDYNGDVTFIEKQGEQITSSIRPLFEENLDIIISMNSLIDIINKIRKYKDFSSLQDIACGRNAFGITGKEDDLTKISKINNFPGAIELKCAHEKIRYTDEKNITKNHKILKSWKIFTSKGNGGAGQLGDGKPVAILGKAFIGAPNSACTDSLIPIGCFSTEIEAINLCKYMATKFLRFMVGILKTSQNLYQNVYKFVPLQDFTENSDINWSKSITKIDESAKAKYGLDINEIDAQLYTKYGLDKSEIEFIEKMIKPME